MSSQSSDGQLITRVVTVKDQEAFAELVRRYQSAIRQFSRRLTAGDYFLSDDIAQETFWLAYQKISTFQGKGSFSSWLHTIAYRQFLKHAGRQSTEEYEDDSHTLDGCTDKAMEADIMAEKLMKQLSVAERVTITLSYSAGMSHQEIADITGFALGTVKSHIKRGKDKLTAIVQQDSAVVSSPH